MRGEGLGEGAPGEGGADGVRGEDGGGGVFEGAQELCSSSPGSSDDIHVFKLCPGGGGEVPEVFEALKTPYRDS